MHLTLRELVERYPELPEYVAELAQASAPGATEPGPRLTIRDAQGRELAVFDGAIDLVVTELDHAELEALAETMKGLRSEIYKGATPWLDATQRLELADVLDGRASRGASIGSFDGLSADDRVRVLRRAATLRTVVLGRDLSVEITNTAAEQQVNLVVDEAARRVTVAAFTPKGVAAQAGLRLAVLSKLQSSLYRFMVVAGRGARPPPPLADGLVPRPMRVEVYSTGEVRLDVEGATGATNQRINMVVDELSRGAEAARMAQVELMRELPGLWDAMRREAPHGASNTRTVRPGEFPVIEPWRATQKPPYRPPVRPRGR